MPCGCPILGPHRVSVRTTSDQIPAMHSVSKIQWMKRVVLLACISLPGLHEAGAALTLRYDFESITDVNADPVIKASLENLDLVRAGYPEFDLETYRAGHLTPVIFGSALKSVSVPEMLTALGTWAPEPRPQPADPKPIEQQTAVKSEAEKAQS